MFKFDKLIEKCIASEDRQTKWRYAVSMYNKATTILYKKGEYMTAEKMQFQLFVD